VSTQADEVVTAPDRDTVAISPASLLASRYVVVSPLGQGGMGQVWRAFDITLERTVALKFLRHQAGARAEARIVREAKAMARLSHPNVLPVFDVARTDDLVFIVMEFVSGQTLREYLARRRTLPEILALFTAAARGLHAAHSAGFVHRDFKPANVLVGDDGRVRVMDFGLVREDTGDSGGEEVAGVQLVAPSQDLTADGEVMGTPAYMAPEQRASSPVDARSDQFSFCVSLYEAVFGRRPTSAPDHVTPAGNAEVPSWLRALLDRGLAYDPAKRHASMAEIVALLERRGGSTRRNVAFAVAGAAIVGLATWASVAPRTHACESTAREIEAGWDPDTRARVEAGLGDAPVPYASDLFGRTAPWLDRYVEGWADARVATCKDEAAGRVPPEITARALECLEEHRADFDLLVERLATADAVIAQDAVSLASNLPLHRECTDPDALALRRPLPTAPEERADGFAIVAALSAVTLRAEAGDHDGAEAELADLIARARVLEDRAPWIRAMALRGKLAETRGDYPTAQAHYEEAFALAREHDAPQIAAEIAIDLVFLVGRMRAQFEEGLLWGRIAHLLLEPDVRDDDVHLDDLRFSGLHTNLGLTLLAAGRGDQALEHLRNAVDISERALGPNHPWLSTSLNNLALAYSELGDYGEAIAIGERALGIAREHLGERHPTVALFLHNLGDAHTSNRELDLGRALNERALAIWRDTLGPDHNDVAMAHNGIATACYDARDFACAGEQLERAVAIWRGHLGDEHPSVGTGLTNLGMVRMNQGDTDAAADMLGQALALRERALGPGHPDVAHTAMGFARVRSQQGRHDEAIALARRAIAIHEAHDGPIHARTRVALQIAGDVELQAGRAAEAVAHLERATAIGAALSLEARDLAATEFMLARALWDAPPAGEREVFDPATRVRALELARTAATRRRAQGPDGAAALQTIERWLAERGE
jgi:serine/threonine-protein kinase